MREAGGILTGPEITRRVAQGSILIDPWCGLSRENPASIDLTLGDYVKVYADVTAMVSSGYRMLGRINHLLSKVERELVERERGIPLENEPTGVLDSRDKLNTWSFKIDPACGWLLKPGIGYLMHTKERVWAKDLVPVIDGKSSFGRLFVTAHVTAGYGDPGFRGQYTLEVVSTYPLIVYPGSRFCQMRFHTTVGEHKDYAENGHYVGEASEGPVASMTWKQFEEERYRKMFDASQRKKEE